MNDMKHTLTDFIIQKLSFTLKEWKYLTNEANKSIDSVNFQLAIDTSSMTYYFRPCH